MTIAKLLNRLDSEGKMYGTIIYGYYHAEQLVPMLQAMGVEAHVYDAVP